MRRPVGLGGGRQVSDEHVEGIEHPEVARGVECLDRRETTRGVCRVDTRGGSLDVVGSLRREEAAQPFAEHLGVPGLAEDPAEPAKVGADLVAEPSSRRGP